MEAQIKVQPLYVFLTQEEERAERTEIDNHGRFARIRRLWVDRRHRQELWLAALEMVKQLQLDDKADVFLDFLKEKRAGKIPCALHPITMRRGQFFPGEEEPFQRDVVNADQVEAEFGYQGWVIGSRYQRSRFWDFVELNLRGYTPSDLDTIHDTEQQFALQRTLMEAWERKWGLELDKHTMSSDTDAADKELGLIYCGHAQGVEIYSNYSMANIRCYAALYAKARHSRSAVCTVDVRKGTKILYLGFPREPIEGERPRVGTRLMVDWLDYGADSIADFPFDAQRNMQAHSRKLPEGLLNVGSEEGSFDEFVEHQLFGLTQGVLRRWPASKAPLLQLIEERLCSSRRRRKDERRFHNPLAEPWVAQVERVEQDILGRVFTQGSPQRREIFWVFMCALSMGMKEFTRSMRIPAEFSPSKRNGFVAMKAAAHLVSEGANPFHVSKLIAYGRGGITSPLPADDPQVLGDTESDYAQLRFIADYGIGGFAYF